MKSSTISKRPASVGPGRSLSIALPRLPFLAATFLYPLASSAQSHSPHDDAVVLDSITVSIEHASTLDRPAQVGSILNLTPRETPASVEVVDRRQIDARGDHSVTDAVTRAGGISAMGHPGNGGSSLSMRGFTDSTSVMRLYDGLRQYGGLGVTFPFDTWSIDRIEVLRGPAAVIHGDGAIGGVVNVVPRQPRHGSIENELQATTGTDNTARLGLDSSGSISDTLSYRVDVSGNRSDNWVDRGKSRDATFAGALQWRVRPDLSMKLTHAYGYQKPMAYFGSPLIHGQQVSALRDKNYNVEDGVIRYRDQWTELDARWTPNDLIAIRAKLYHVRSKRHWHNAERYVFGPRTGLIDRSENTEILHDQRQTGVTASAALEGLVGRMPNTFAIGFDVNSSRFQHSNNNFSGSSGPVDPYHPVPGYFHGDEPTLPRYRNVALQYALFMEDRLELTDRWAVIGGLRYDHADVRREDLLLGARTLDRSYSELGYRLGTVYDLSPGFSVYAQYAHAADPVSGLLMLSATNSAFEMATGRQLEMGLKQDLWQGKGEWTLAAYHIKKTDLLSRDATDPSRRVQVGKQSTRGLEASLRIDLTRNWSVQANGTILRARFDDFNEPAGAATVSRQGKVPPNVAQKLANVWLSWRFQPRWTAMGGMQYVGKRYADNANTLALPSYTSTDLALRWRLNKQTTLTARGFNIFDRAYFTTAYYTPTQWLYGPGRRFELTLNHHF